MGMEKTTHNQLSLSLMKCMSDLSRVHKEECCIFFGHACI